MKFPRDSYFYVAIKYVQHIAENTTNFVILMTDQSYYMSYVYILVFCMFHINKIITYDAISTPC